MGLACFWTAGRGSRADDVAANEQERQFESKVRPILVQRCTECHGPKKQEGGLRLDQRASALRGNDAGPVILAGQPDESRLVQVIRYADDDVQMPPTEKLPEAEIDVLAEWIRNGAHWPAETDGGASTDGIPRREDGSIDFAQAVAAHWSYRPVTRPAMPATRTVEACGSLARNALDRFVAAALEEQGMSLSPQADRRTLIRRATFDLLGIPPTYGEVAAFVADPAPDAYERLIDRLLASPTRRVTSSRRTASTPTRTPIATTSSARSTPTRRTTAS
jgi:mono/diheme cytochrome c family protein